MTLILFFVLTFAFPNDSSKEGETLTTTVSLSSLTTYSVDRYVETIAYGNYYYICFVQELAKNDQVDWSFKGSNSKVGIIALAMDNAEMFKFKQAFQYNASELSSGAYSEDYGTFTIPYTDQWCLVFWNKDPAQQSTTVTIELEIEKVYPNRAPTVQIISPEWQETVRGTYLIRWSANDPDGDALTFTVRYSRFNPNGERSWTLLASNLTVTSCGWDTSDVPGWPTGYVIEVEASDGVHTTKVESDQFHIIIEQPPAAEGGGIPSFGTIGTLGVILVLLGWGKRWRKMRG